MYTSSAIAVKFGAGRGEMQMGELKRDSGIGRNIRELGQKLMNTPWDVKAPPPGVAISGLDGFSDVSNVSSTSGAKTAKASEAETAHEASSSSSSSSASSAASAASASAASTPRVTPRNIVSGPVASNPANDADSTLIAFLVARNSHPPGSA
jgi:hypothetical protein